MKSWSLKIIQRTKRTKLNLIIYLGQFLMFFSIKIGIFPFVNKDLENEKSAFWRQNYIRIFRNFKTKFVILEINLYQNLQFLSRKNLK